MTNTTKEISHVTYNEVLRATIQRARRAEAQLKSAVEQQKRAEDAFAASCSELFTVERLARALLADVHRRYPGEALRCPFMQALEDALDEMRKSGPDPDNICPTVEQR